jgi:Holliday junction resolvase RusA-like endonuclease
LEVSYLKAYRFTIYGRLDGLNTVIDANRRNKYSGAKIKAQNDKICRSYIPQKLKGIRLPYPVIVTIDWYEKDRRRDLDNIYSGKKFILDSLVECGVLQGDGQKWVIGLVDRIHTDRKNPRIEVSIMEAGGDFG